MIRSPLAPALILAALLAVAGCSSDPPAPTPAQPTGSATPAPTGASAPPPTHTTPTPPPTTTPTAAPAAGLEWSVHPLPVDAGWSTVGAIDVTSLDGVFLAAGVAWQEDAGGVTDNVPLFWRSPDGRAWELLDAEWPGGHIDVLTTWQGRYLAAGYVGEERASAAFWSSADGSAWERLPDQAVLEFFRGATEGRDIVAGGISHVHTEGDVLVARGWLYCACAAQVRDGAVEWRTSDGREWQRAELPPGGDVAPSLEVPGGLLRIAEGGSAIELAAEGGAWQTAWEPVALSPDDDPSAQLFALGHAPDGFLAVGVALEGEGAGRPLALTSTDGRSWTASVGPGVADVTGAMLDFASGPSSVVAVGRIGDTPQPFVWLHVVP